MSEKWIDFCIAKCGEGYCTYMHGEGGMPCIEVICAFCHHASPSYCKFCRGE